MAEHVGRQQSESAHIADRNVLSQVAAANRVISAMLVAGAVSVLAVAYLLAPSPTGWGTHQQLFLMPCLFHWLTGLPCPFCGMTTGFAHMARGHVVAAFYSHVLSPLAFALTALVALGGIRGLVTGRPPLPRSALSNRFGMIIICVLILGWLANIALVLGGA